MKYFLLEVEYGSPLIIGPFSSISERDTTYENSNRRLVDNEGLVIKLFVDESGQLYAG